MVWRPKPSPALPRRRTPTPSSSMSTPGTEEYGLRSSALCVDGPRNRQRGPAPHTGHRRRDVHGRCLLDSGYAPTPCRGVRLTGQTPEPTKAHAQSDTGPDIADHAPASSTSHAGPTVSSPWRGGCCLVGGRNRCDSEDRAVRGLTLYSPIAVPAVLQSCILSTAFLSCRGKRKQCASEDRL